MTAPLRGACAVCSRPDVPLRDHGRAVQFHYAAVCGLPCEGGKLGARDRAESPRTHPLGCRCAPLRSGKQFRTGRSVKPAPVVVPFRRPGDEAGRLRSLLAALETSAAVVRQRLAEAEAEERRNRRNASRRA